jgi:hypothetical protein
MEQPKSRSIGILVLTGAVAYLLSGCEQKTQSLSQVERGKYLVMVGGCNDCHTPKIMTPQGPVLDTTRLLSGHPSSQPLPPIPQGVVGPGKWGAVTNNDLTAWYGPWGVSFAYNLTPDAKTGIGGWTEAMFIQTLRSGKFMGMSRPILPPMPWESLGRMTDDDLKAMFAYLNSLPPINNATPQPIPPAGE